MQDLVIGIDASTTAVKAIAFTRSGKALIECRAAYPMQTPHPGHYEQYPSDWWKALCLALQELTAAIDPKRLAGIALTHQRETFALLDEKGEALRPAILWLDERARRQVTELSSKIGRNNIRDWTGKPPDPTPALYSLVWLNEHEPEVISRTSVLVDTGSYLHLKLTGNAIAATASADPLGILDIQTKTWRPELVGVTGLRIGQLSGLAAPSALIGEVSATASKACGLLAGTPVFAAAGDGQANSLGLGVYQEGHACFSLGSGVVSGMYSSGFMSNDAFRTLIAPSGHGYLLETVLRSGMQLVEWVVRTTGSVSAPELEKQAICVEAGSDGLLLLPYFAGVMSPFWDDAARGVMLGLSLSHEPKHIYRAAIEGIAFEQALATAAMENSIGKRASKLIASGGGTNSKLLMSVLASTLQRPLAVSSVAEAAALGAAMLAATGAGWFADANEASAAMCCGVARTVEPDENLMNKYARLNSIYADYYRTIQPLQTALGRIG